MSSPGEPTRRAVLAGAAALTWMPSSALATLPEPGSRPWFEAYLAAFNRGDFAGFSAYYAPDVRFDGQAATLEGAAAVVAFYRNVRSRLDETIELLSFVGTPSRIGAEIRTAIIAREDWPDFPTGALKAGQRRASINFAMYEIAGGRFTRIRSARYRSFPHG